MKHPVLHESSRTPQAGIDCSINQDDAADHPFDADAPHAGRDLLSGASAWDKPGLVNPVQVDFDFGPTQERRRH